MAQTPKTGNDGMLHWPSVPLKFIIAEGTDHGELCYDSIVLEPGRFRDPFRMFVK